MRFDSRRTWWLPVLFASAALVATTPRGRADDFTMEPGFESLFNGKDLNGWRLGLEMLAGKTESADHRFAAVDGVLVITGAPKVEEIDTVAEFNRDFVLRFEFRASPKANSGLHLRDHAFAHQLQIRDYPSVGPYKSLKNYKNGDWNAIEVTVTTDPNGKVKGPVARCTCNGEVLEDAMALPAKGAIGLQSETNKIEYRRIRIKSTAAQR